MDDANKLLWIAETLTSAFETPVFHPRNPVENLVLTILSQNTTDTNRDRAYDALIQQFNTLDEVLIAPIDAVAAAIQIGGLHHQKARSIHAALKRIMEEQGRLDLSFLADLSLQEALSWLLELPGVGPKTAGIVLLFSFDRPVFPADTHVRRVMSRMGLVAQRGDPHPTLNRLLPADADLMQRLHLLTIRLGREVCHPKSPACEGCPLRPQCVWTRTHGPGMEDGVRFPVDKGGTAE